MTPLFKLLLLVLGVASLGISAAHIVLGSEAIPGSEPVNATMDNQDRFFAALFFGYGVSVLWCLRDWSARLSEIRFLAAILFLGGFARLVSVAVAGWPHPFYVAMMIVELALPIAVIWLSTRVGEQRPTG